MIAFVVFSSVTGSRYSKLDNVTWRWKADLRVMFWIITKQRRRADF